MQLRDLTWIEAERVLTPDTICVLPIGAAAKEHGPHLRLDNDQVLVESWARLLEARRPDLVFLPTLTYSFYPAFAEYPGSTSLRLETARDLVVDVVTSIAKYGPRRFYALNSGVSTNRALLLAQEQLTVNFVFTDLLKTLAPIEKEISQQVRGTHADEIETSLMLYLAPERVDFGKAVKDDEPHRPGGLSRNPDGPGTYSQSGVWGDATLATREKGEFVMTRFLDALIAEIDSMRGE